MCWMFLFGFLLGSIFGASLLRTQMKEALQLAQRADTIVIYEVNGPKTDHPNIPEYFERMNPN